jgi:hypothetical protein
MPDVAIDAQTGDERSSSAENMRWLRSDNMRPPFALEEAVGGDLSADLRRAIAGEAARFPNPPFYVRNPDGTRGILNRSCTRDYKIRPVQRKCRDLLGIDRRARIPKHPIVELWIGITIDEAHRMAPAREPWIYHRHPLCEIGWTRWECETWLFEEYGIRFGHSGCISCPFRSNVEWLHMQRDHPDDFARAVEVDKLIRRGLRNVRGEAFLHDSLRPLGEIDFDEEIAARQGQLLGWAGACGGMCGV